MKSPGEAGSRAVVARLLLVLATAGALALAACGTSTTTSTTPSAAASEAAASPTPSWSPTMSPAPIPVVKPGEKLPAFAKLQALFAYDSSEPLAYAERGSSYDQVVAGVTLRGITFQSGGQPTDGYLVVPQGDGPFPVVLYAPGSGDPADMWAKDAAVLAKQGYAGLMLEEPWAAPAATGAWDVGARKEARDVANYTVQERRALDLLATLPKIDMTRVGFVGWSYGASIGARLAGVEDRVKAYVLIGVATSPTWSKRPFAKDFFHAPKGAAWDRYVAQYSVIDEVSYVGHNKGAAFLFLNGNTDWAPMHNGKAFLAAAPKPKTWHVFAGPHDPRVSAAAMKYWHDWILKNL